MSTNIQPQPTQPTQQPQGGGPATPSPSSLTPPDVCKWWANKRRLAWSSFAGLMGTSILAAFMELTPPQSDVLTAVAYMFGTIIGVYIGFSAHDDMVARNGRK